MSMKMLAGYTYACLIKRIELVETLFYALRKKSNQVSFLHVYHHISTLWLAWASCKYVSGGMITFSIVINTYVHLFMYTYYLLTAMGGGVREKISTIKPLVTVIQLVRKSRDNGGQASMT
jgi:energy-converting hydrogenase Eha subunit C